MLYVSVPLYYLFPFLRMLHQLAIALSIDLSHGVSHIGEWAFKDCSYFSSIIIPPTVILIGTGAFYNCSSLKSIIIPPSVTRIAECAFKECKSLICITIQSKIVKIESSAFSNCSKLVSVLLPARVSSIKYDIFEGFNNSLQGSFNRYALLLDDIGKTVIGICEGFEGRIEIPEGIDSIGKSAFSKSKVTEVKFPKSLRFIEEKAFANCSMLFAIYIDDHIDSIGLNAYYGCKQLHLPKYNCKMTRNFHNR